VQIEAPAKPVTVVTNRFFLEDLVWACLSRAMHACAPGQPVRIVAEQIENTARIRFYGLAGDFLSSDPCRPSPHETRVAGFLGARLSIDEEKGAIDLILP
jgi:hypothetical protein